MRVLIAERVVLRRLLSRSFREEKFGAFDHIVRVVAADVKQVEAMLLAGGLERAVARYLDPDIDDLEFVLEDAESIKPAETGQEARRLAIRLIADCVAMLRLLRLQADVDTAPFKAKEPLHQVARWLRKLRPDISQNLWQIGRGEVSDLAELEADAGTRVELYMSALRSSRTGPINLPTPEVVAPPPEAKRSGKPAAKAETAGRASKADAPAKPAPEPIENSFPVYLRTEACFNDYLPTFRSQSNALERVALRERSWRTRELLARTASEGIMAYDALVDFCRTIRGYSSARAAATLLGFDAHRARCMASLARIVANQGLSERDATDALEIYQALHAIAPQALRAIDYIQFCILKLARGEIDAASGLLEQSKLEQDNPLEAALLFSNILRAYTRQDAMGGANSFEHLQPLNLLYRKYGMEPVRRRESANPFSGLHAGPLDHYINDGPKVTVLMTTYNPTVDMSVAVNSVLAQSWRNLELIIIDDCSADDLFTTVKAWEERDPRIKVLRQSVNGGTYVAKNQGLAVADGEFITCHDSDDWSHPRKIEHQMETLARSDAPACSSQWVRASLDLEFLLFSGSGFLSYENPSSLLYRRDAIRDRVGFYDSVRTGADSEMKHRIETVFGKSVVEASEVPLAFGLVHDGALTANTLGRGWFSPERRFYRSAWRAWHDRIAEGSDDPYLPLETLPRRFEVPPGIRPNRPEPKPEGHREQFDVVMISDFRMGGGNTMSTLEEILAQNKGGLRTAICQVGAFRKGFFHKEFIDSKVQEAVSAGLVEWIDLSEQVDTKLLTIRYPGVFQFADRLESGIQPETVMVILNQPPAEANSLDRRYDVEDCRANIDRIFGRQQKWAPIGPAVRDAIDPASAIGLLTESDWVNIVDVSEYSGPRSGFVGDRPVLGRHGRDDYSKWPETREAVFQAYPDTPDFAVRILGGAASLKPLIGEQVPDNWTVLEFNSVRVPKYLETIDFFVFHHHPARIEAFGRTVIEAMAAGCVAILPPSFRPLFQDSVIYCSPAEVKAVAINLYKDLERFKHLSKKGYDFVCKNFGYEAHSSRLNLLGVGSRVIGD
ncbi:hypothetical protein TS85_00330 [Sphingomonas hengshuiensis]|uniref:Glycosyltransferase 2-like domain-containing protein n=1 Tax=Sphingomonas hengshuiensis TaxID=1609977 RepID=A0A7U5BE98_9SPHN|nr:hypothetical protein TS85_00330 [Sphingomonas hengshuiensis]